MLRPRTGTIFPSGPHADEGAPRDLAAREVVRARGGEIQVSGTLRQLVESTADLRFGAVRKVELKGISAPQDLVEACWKDRVR